VAWGPFGGCSAGDHDCMNPLRDAVARTQACLGPGLRFICLWRTRVGWSAPASSCSVVLLCRSNVAVRCLASLRLAAGAPPCPSRSSGLTCRSVRRLVRRALLVSSMRVIRAGVSDERSVSVSLLLGVAVPTKRTAYEREAMPGRSHGVPAAFLERSRCSGVLPTFEGRLARGGTYAARLGSS
jgi:hypothetical protein